MTEANPARGCDLDSNARSAHEAVQRGEALRRTGHLNEAEELLSLTTKRFPNDAAAALAYARVANARRDWPTALSRWESVRERFPGNAWGHLGSALALRATGQSDAADHCLSLAEATLSTAAGSPTAANIKLGIEIAKARANWQAVKDTALRGIEGGVSTDAMTFLALAQACWHLQDREGADRVAQQALDQDPTLSEAILVHAWVATDSGNAQRAIRCYRRLVELNPDAVRWRLKLIQLLNWQGELEQALTELKQLNRRWPDVPAVRAFTRDFGPAASLQLPADGPGAGTERDADDAKLQTLIDRAPSRRLRPLLQNNPDRDVLTASVEHAETAVLVFTGSNDAVSMPLAIFDPYLAALPVTTIYLKDFQRLRFLFGVRSWSPDYAGTLTALGELLNELGAQRLCTLGNCDGGFAAIRYGVDLGAERILAFNAPTHSPRDSSQVFEQARNFKRTRLAELGGDAMGDVKTFLEKRQHGSRIELFYEDEDTRDRQHALYLAGLPGVTLHPLPGTSNHHLLREFALSSADFSAALAQLLNVPHPPTALP